MGEVGTIPPGAAVGDALADHGVELHALPGTPEAVRRAPAGRPDEAAEHLDPTPGDLPEGGVGY